MTINTVLGNREHPEYGVVSVPFPIANRDYPGIMEMINALDVGDVMAADCYIAEIRSPLPALQCLEETEVNLDELDFLVKRLDSFSEYELLQFQAMAAKHGYCEVKNLLPPHGLGRCRHVCGVSGETCFCSESFALCSENSDC